MASSSKSLYDARFDAGVIPRDIRDDVLDGVDDLSMRQQRHERFSQDTRFRKHLAIWVMYIVPIWLFAVIVVFVLCGCRILCYNSEVMIALLASTTINVLGLAYIVLKGIFSDGNR